MMHSCIGCICLTFLHCVSSNVSSNDVGNRLHSHTACICLTFLHCVFSNVPSNYLYYRMHIHIGCTCLTSFFGPDFVTLMEASMLTSFGPKSLSSILWFIISMNQVRGKSWMLSLLMFLLYWFCLTQIDFFWGDWKTKMKVKYLRAPI